MYIIIVMGLLWIFWGVFKQCFRFAGIMVLIGIIIGLIDVLPYLIK